MTATAHLYLSYGPAGDNDYYDLSAPLPPGSAWHVSDLHAASTWNSGRGPFGSPPEIPVGTGSGSFAQFLSVSSAATLGELDVDFNNCNGTTTQRYALDDITTGLTTGTTPDATTTNTTVDFEASPPTVLTPHLSATTITSGGTVTPSVTVSVKSEKDMSGFVVTLSKKAAGTSTYRTVATRTTNSAGLATAPAQKLTRSTSYRWTYVPLPQSIFEAGTSKTATVNVASKVMMHWPRPPSAGTDHCMPRAGCGRATPAQGSRCGRGSPDTRSPQPATSMATVRTPSPSICARAATGSTSTSPRTPPTEPASPGASRSSSDSDDRFRGRRVTRCSLGVAGVSVKTIAG